MVGKIILGGGRTTDLREVGTDARAREGLQKSSGWSGSDGGGSGWSRGLGDGAKWMESGYFGDRNYWCLSYGRTEGTVVRP